MRSFILKRDRTHPERKLQLINAETGEDYLAAMDACDLEIGRKSGETIDLRIRHQVGVKIAIIIPVDVLTIEDDIGSEPTTQHLIVRERPA